MPKMQTLSFCVIKSVLQRLLFPVLKLSPRSHCSVLCLFQYICYPWKDDSGVPASEKRELCRKSKDCSERGQTCQRHQDRRKINKGLCMNEVRSCIADKSQTKKSKKLISHKK